MSLRTRVLRGAALGAAIPDIARLRIAVFREWPYLYDGDMTYEEQYLSAYTAPGAVCVAAYDGGRMVGASTGAPMANHAEDFAAALPGDIPVDQTFYCAESVLEPAYRGRGLYRAFFAEREAAGRSQGLAWSVFAAVIRPDDHPARPVGAESLAPVWRHFGYVPREGAIARFAWRDVGAAAETEKPLQLWAKRFAPDDSP
ncbi:MAG: GNAT family N-acetyltransferase [Shimia sp.]